MNIHPSTHTGLLRAAGRAAASTAILLSAMVLPWLAGCGEGGVSGKPTASAAAVPAIDAPISANELALFLAVVESHPKRQVPEFAQLDAVPPVDDSLSGPDLATEYRQRLRRLFDPRVQGERLANDSVWSKILRERRLDPAEFASLVLRLSCAVTRHQLAARHDLARISKGAEARIEELVADIRKTDATPPAKWTNELTFGRTRSVVQLGQSAALAEFASLLESVPPTRSGWWSGTTRPCGPHPGGIGGASLRRIGRVVAQIMDSGGSTITSCPAPVAARRTGATPRGTPPPTHHRRPGTGDSVGDRW